MPSTDTIHIALESSLAQALRDSVEAGEYSSVDDAMREAVGLWQARRSAEALASVKARIHRSANDPRPGLSSEEVDERLETLFGNSSSAGTRA